MLRPVLCNFFRADLCPAGNGKNGLGGGALRWSFRHRRDDLVGLGAEATPQIAGYGDQGIPCSLPQQTCAYACLCMLMQYCPKSELPGNETPASCFRFPGASHSLVQTKRLEA